MNQEDKKMDFSTKNLSNIFKIVLGSIVTIAAVYLFFNIFPVILIAALIIWAVYKTVKWTGKRKKSHIDVVSKNSKDNFSYDKSKIIDVDYEDVK